MREISLHLMDIVQNSIEAGATFIIITIEENTNDDYIHITIKDNGFGIEPELIEKIKDPFVTSRKTRRVGLGISLFEAACNRCGGGLSIESLINSGTEIKASLEYNHVDRAPMGRIEDTIVSFLMTKRVDILYKHIFNNKEFVFDSREIKKAVGGELNDLDIINWIKEYISEGIENIGAIRF